MHFQGVQFPKVSISSKYVKKLLMLVILARQLYNSLIVLYIGTPCALHDYLGNIQISVLQSLFISILLHQPLNAGIPTLVTDHKKVQVRNNDKSCRGNHLQFDVCNIMKSRNERCLRVAPIHPPNRMVTILILRSVTVQCTSDISNIRKT